LNDNGLGTLAEVLEGVELPLQVQTNISGGDRSAPTPVRVSPADTDAPAPHLVEPGRAVTTLVAAVIGGLVLGVLLVLVAARLRRSPA
jgi:hypothetical protein